MTRGLCYAGVILWVNAYICRDWLYHPTAWMNTLHGYWAAIARLADGWLRPSWWPYWDFGIPFEFTSAPLAPAMAAGIAGLRHVSHLMAVQTVSLIFFCAAPVALFVMAWLLTRDPEYSFFAALFYSLLAPAQILAPDGVFSWAAFLSPHRFLLQALWDETPRCAALTFLLFFALFLASAIETRRRVYFVGAAFALALAMLASPFAAISAGISVFCLITALQPKAWRIEVAGIAFLGYALAARFLPPSLWFAIGAASAAHETWNFGVFKMYAGIAVGWVTLVHYLPRWTKDWRVRFFALWAYAMSCAPMLAHWFDRRILPQPHRFRIEMEAAVALLVIFGLRPLLQRMPPVAKAAAVAVILWLAGEQIVHHRRLAKDALYPADVTRTIEYRAAQRIAHELPGARVMLPGSIAHWANAFTNIQQFSGSEGTMAYSQAQQRAMTAVYEGDARVAVALLQASCSAAVVVSGPESKEQWKPFSDPKKFDGVLPVLWSEAGVTAYSVPPAGRCFTWNNFNSNTIRSETTSTQIIPTRISYHPGWHATIGGRPVELVRDELGLMWVRPDRAGPVEVELRYDGGWELRLCGWLSIAAILCCGLLLVRR